MAKHFRRCAVCAARFDDRKGHTCPADCSPAGCADVKPVKGRAPQRTKVSATARRSVETALLRLMPGDALREWQCLCQERADEAHEARDNDGWRYWHGQMARVRAIREERDCPPPAARRGGTGELTDDFDGAPRFAPHGEDNDEHDPVSAHVEDGAPLPASAPPCERCQRPLQWNGAEGYACDCL